MGKLSAFIRGEDACLLESNLTSTSGDKSHAGGIDGTQQESLQNGITLNELPVWCSLSCAHIEAIKLSEGMVYGCVRPFNGPEWAEQWTRLSKLKCCPRR